MFQLLLHRSNIHSSNLSISSCVVEIPLLNLSQKYNLLGPSWSTKRKSAGPNLVGTAKFVLHLPLSLPRIKIKRVMISCR